MSPFAQRRFRWREQRRGVLLERLDGGDLLLGGGYRRGKSGALLQGLSGKASRRTRRQLRVALLAQDGHVARWRGEGEI